MTISIKDFLAKDDKGRFFINVRDKIETSKILDEREERYCPPHKLPHTFPVVGKEITDEICHIHITNWRYYTHHLIYCSLKKCPNVEAMKKSRERYFTKQEHFLTKSDYLLHEKNKAIGCHQIQKT